MKHPTWRASVALVLTLFSLQLLTPFVGQVSASQSTQVALHPTDDAFTDSFAASSNYGSSVFLAVLQYSCFLCTSRTIQSWLKFDLSSVPPAAIITSATLTLTLGYAKVPATVGVYQATSTAWSENSITWNNEPAGTVSSSAVDSRSVSNSTTTYMWNVVSLIGPAAGNSLSLVLQPTGSQGSNPNGFIVFYSKEGGGSAFGPSLSIVYTYASATVSLSAGSVQFGNSVTVTSTTDPAQTLGTTTLQYSIDQVTWLSFAFQSGGVYSYQWTAPFTGIFYVRSTWAISWSKGSYTANSLPIALNVTRAPSSAQLTLSKSVITIADTVTIGVNLVPPASDGVVTIQESLDQTHWNTIDTGTPSGGSLSYNWSPGAVNTYYLRAVWSGDSNYLGTTSSSQVLSVGLIPTSILIGAPGSASLGSTITITAALRDARGNSIPGATLSFQFDSVPIGNGITDSSGSVVLIYTLTASAGNHLIGASYPGSSMYKPSSALAGLGMNPWRLTVTSSVPRATLVSFNGMNHTTDASGTVVISVNSTGTYSLNVNSPLVISEGTRVVFLGWGDGVLTSTRTVDVHADVSYSVTTKTQYLLTLASPYGSPAGAGWYNTSLSARFSVQTPVDQGNGTRRVLTGWTENGVPFSNSASGTIQMNAPTTLTALWKKQFQLTVVSQYGDPSGQGWYDQGSTATGAVTSPFSTTTGTRFVVINYTVSGPAPNSGNMESVPLVMDGPKTLSFQWKTQYYLTVTTEQSSVTGAGWYDSGSRAVAAVQADMVTPSNVTRFVLVRYVGSGSAPTSGSGVSASFVISSPSGVQFKWKTQYYLLVVTKVGIVNGSGWYDAGSQANAVVKDTSVPVTLFESKAFSGWVGNVSAKSNPLSITINAPEVETATWSDNFSALYLAVGVVSAVAVITGYILFRKFK